MQGRPSNQSGSARATTVGTRVGAGAAIMRPGAMLGRYELVVRLARGATSEIWVAKGSDGSSVAIKALRLDVPQTPELLRGFAHEATVGNKLHHPNIVELVDAGRVGPRYFLAMEYVDGMSLEQLGRQRTDGARLPLRLLARLVQQICMALHYAHELRSDNGPLDFLHRNLCPENILISVSGAAKLIDFGMARMKGVPTVAAPRLSRACYCAPEQLQGREEDRRVDVYSMGVVLCEQAAGISFLDGAANDPKPLVKDLPEGLAEIIMRAMAADPAERYPNCQEMAVALEAFGSANFQDGPWDDALEEALGRIFDAPLGSEPPWESQPLPLLADEPSATPGSGSEERERFAPDADFSTDDITRPTAVLLSDQRVAATPAQADAMTERKSSSGPGQGAWSSERQEALSHVAFDVFGSSRRAASRAFASDEPAADASDAYSTPRSTVGRATSDVFSIYTRNGHAHAAATPPPIPRPERPSSPAVRSFDRGLELLQAKLHEQALVAWEEACRLDPENRVYQTNLKRLRAQIAARARSQTTESS